MITPVVLLALVGFGTIGSACRTGGEDTTSVTSAPPSSPSGASSSSPSSTPPTGETQAADAWRKLWTAATRQPGTEEAARNAADPAVVDRLLALTRDPRTVTNSPTTTAESDQLVQIDDCAFISPTLSASATIGFTGTATKQPDNSWRVTELAPRNGQLLPCAPKAMEQAALAGYRSYWDARPSYWDPADPASPLIDDTTTGARRDNIKKQLQADLSANHAFRGRPELHPETIEVHTLTELVILDCQLQDPGWGVYDRATGTLTGETPQVSPGRRDLRSTMMRLDGGKWKVADIQGREGATCDFAPTTRGLPVL